MITTLYHLALQAIGGIYAVVWLQEINLREHFAAYLESEADHARSYPR